MPSSIQPEAGGARGRAASRSVAGFGQGRRREIRDSRAAAAKESSAEREPDPDPGGERRGVRKPTLREGTVVRIREPSGVIPAGGHGSRGPRPPRSRALTGADLNPRRTAAGRAQANSPAAACRLQRPWKP